MEEVCKMGGILVAIIANHFPHSLKDSVLIKHNPRLSRPLILDNFWIRIFLVIKVSIVGVALEVRLFWQDLLMG